LGPTELARFEEMLLPHLDDAYTLARYLVRDEYDAQDVVQEAYLRAVRHFGALRGDGRAWLLAIVRNCARTWRHRRRADALTTEFDEERHSGDSGGGDAEAGLVRGEARETLRRALDRLPAEFREALVLRELNGLSYREIAQATGSPVGTVMSRLARARRKLLEALGPGAKEEV
jgi:RNA polymerase sigma-70 factor (ECF subfamily)